MSVVLVNDSGSQTYLGRVVGTSEFPTNEFALTWHVRQTSLRAAAYGSYCVVARTSGFIGGNEYFTAADGDGATHRHWHLGQDGGDTDHATLSPVVGVWYRQAFQRLKNGAIWESRFWFDLDGGQSLVLQAPDDATEYVWSSDNALCFGSVPYIYNEGITGSMRCMKAWSIPRTIDELDTESRSSVINTAGGTTGLWGRWPCVWDGQDLSGNARTLTPSISGGSLTFDGQDFDHPSGRTPTRILRPRLFAPGRAR